MSTHRNKNKRIKMKDRGATSTAKKNWGGKQASQFPIGAKKEELDPFEKAIMDSSKKKKDRS